MSRQRKRDAVLRLLRGEDLETVSRSLGVTAATLTTWRDPFLAAGEAALTSQPTDGETLESERLTQLPDLPREHDSATMRERSRRRLGTTPRQVSEEPSETAKCEIAPKRPPHQRFLQRFDKAYQFRSEWGPDRRRSRPWLMVNTPSYQELVVDRRWGPARVLIHNSLQSLERGDLRRPDGSATATCSPLQRRSDLDRSN